MRSDPVNRRFFREYGTGVFLFYKFIAFPVVDEHGKLVGIAKADNFIEDSMARAEENGT